MGQPIGRATNNEAEYRALLLGIERASELGATEVELIGDSELVVRQVSASTSEEGGAEAAAFARLERAAGVRLVVDPNRPREQNEAADALVNETLDGP